MSSRKLVGGLVVLTALVSGLFGRGESELKTLYDAHRWRELYGRVQAMSDAPALYRGAMGVAFHQRAEEAERLLLSVIREKPSSPEAYDAYEWLSHLYLYRGQYRSLIETMESRWRAFPGKPERSQEEGTMAGLRGLPDQVMESSSASVLMHEPGSIFVPFSIDGGQATYFFDTGAWFSCMSESEAKRLHLKISDTTGSTGQSAGAQVGYRTAVAANVTIGNTNFKDVSFAVFPDDQEPWVDLPMGRKGIIGVPLLVALRTVRWQKDGSVEFGGDSKPFGVRKANLVFDDDHIIVSAMVQGRKVDATVDTGAVSTDFYKPFAETFAGLVKSKGTRSITPVHGVGHAENFESVTLAKLNLQLGGAHAVLAPAHVLLKSIGAKGCVGNFGMDLFSQRGSFEIDFGAMRLVLRPN